MNSFTSLYERDEFIENTFQELILAIDSKWLSLSSQEKAFLQEVYYYVEKKYKGRKRKDGSDEFAHMLDVTFMFLGHFEEVTFEEVVVCLLHDVLEDFPQMLISELEEKFWQGIVKKIKKLTKKDWLYYIKNCYQSDFSTPEEKENICLLREANWTENLDNILILDSVKEKLRDLRNEDYFWSMLSLDISLLRVKVIDRLCSLRTMKGFWDKEKILKKVEETENYFLIPRVKQFFLKEFCEIRQFCVQIRLILSVDDIIASTFLRKNDL